MLSRLAEAAASASALHRGSLTQSWMNRKEQGGNSFYVYARKIVSMALIKPPLKADAVQRIFIWRRDEASMLFASACNNEDGPAM